MRKWRKLELNTFVVTQGILIQMEYYYFMFISTPSVKWRGNYCKRNIMIVDLLKFLLKATLTTALQTNFVGQCLLKNSFSDEWSLDEHGFILLLFYNSFFLLPCKDTSISCIQISSLKRNPHWFWADLYLDAV